MTTFAIIGIAAACVLLALVLFRIQNISNLVGKGADLSPVLSDLGRHLRFRGAMFHGHLC
jgi:hypothetical protein